MTKQSDLIGNHPNTPNIFGRWLSSTDHPDSETQCYRELIEKGTCDKGELIDWLSDLIINYHYKENQIKSLKKKYESLGFPEYAEQTRMFPRAELVQKGNTGESVLSEYLIASNTNGLHAVQRFRYNQNVDTSMRGDDTLLVHFDDDKNEIELYLGEAKFRQTPDKAVVETIANSLSKDKKPISFTFLVQRLMESDSTEELAEKLDDFVLETVRGKGNITYAGLLFSNNDSQSFVLDNLVSNNPKFVFLSLAVDDPSSLIKEVFDMVEEKIKNPKTL